MEPIKGVIQSVINNLTIKKAGGTEVNPWALLEKALTKKDLRHIKFNYFKKGILSVSVDSSSWLYDLSLRKENLLQEINKESSLVKDIRFHIGTVK
ncbi:MAG: DciA family protein [Candidatus Omnitrophota bacterium]|nr:DciA family protein [Candidatus Omnitrophota bacterium]